MQYGQTPESAYSHQPQHDGNGSIGAPPQPFRSSSTNSSTHSSDNELMGGAGHQGGGGYPYQHSNPSLPRYQSQQQLPQHPSPLNPSAVPRQQYQREGTSSSQTSSRFSSYGNPQHGQGNGAHPLSNTMYMDSSPTLAGSEVLSPSDEKMRLGNNDQLGEYIAPSNVNTSGQAPYRRGPLKATGFTAVYRAWSGANLGDSGKDERHIKLPRLGYLDGIKFIAAWVVLNGTFFDAVIGDNDYSFIQRNSPLYITR